MSVFEKNLGQNDEQAFESATEIMLEKGWENVREEFTHLHPSIIEKYAVDSTQGELFKKGANARSNIPKHWNRAGLQNLTLMDYVWVTTETQRFGLKQHSAGALVPIYKHSNSR